MYVYHALNKIKPLMIFWIESNYEKILVHLLKNCNHTIFLFHSIYLFMAYLMIQWAQDYTALNRSNESWLDTTW